MLKSCMGRSGIQVWGVNLAYNVDICVSWATATLSAGFQATWKYLLHGYTLSASPAGVWNKCFPRGRNQWALELDRALSKNLMTADRLSKELFCSDFTQDALPHQPRKLSEPEKRCNAMHPSFGLNSQRVVAYVLLIHIWFLFIITITRHSLYGSDHTSLLILASRPYADPQFSFVLPLPQPCNFRK